MNRVVFLDLTEDKFPLKVSTLEATVYDLEFNELGQAGIVFDEESLFGVINEENKNDYRPARYQMISKWLRKSNALVVGINLSENMKEYVDFCKKIGMPLWDFDYMDINTFIGGQVEYWSVVKKKASFLSILDNNPSQHYIERLEQYIEEKKLSLSEFIELNRNKVKNSHSRWAEIDPSYTNKIGIPIKDDLIDIAFLHHTRYCFPKNYEIENPFQRFKYCLSTPFQEHDAMWTPYILDADVYVTSPQYDDDPYTKALKMDSIARTQRVITFEEFEEETQYDSSSTSPLMTAMESFMKLHQSDGHPIKKKN